MALAGLPQAVFVFLEKVMDQAIRTPMFQGIEDSAGPFALQDLPPQPLPREMIEFVPSAPWDDDDSWYGDDSWYDIHARPDPSPPFQRWRESIRPVAQTLEAALGEPVYCFADLDDVHRFLVLHWLCCYRPKSSYVRYLLQASGAPDVDSLKAALIDPANYTQPFRMCESFWGMETRFGRFTYPNLNEADTNSFGCDFTSTPKP